jgi:DNA mismatch repair protein MutS
VVQQAKFYLQQLEEQQKQNQLLSMPRKQPSLEPAPTAPHPVVTQLLTVVPEDLTPRQALDLIYQLKALMESKL